MLSKKINFEFIIILIILIGILFLVKPDYKVEKFCKVNDRNAKGGSRCLRHNAGSISVGGGNYVFIYDKGGYTTTIDKTTNSQKEKVWKTACRANEQGNDCSVRNDNSPEDASSSYRSASGYYTCPDGKVGTGCIAAFDNYFEKGLGSIGKLNSYKDMGYSCDVNIAGVNYKSTIPLKYNNNILSCASADNVSCLKRKDYNECNYTLNFVPENIPNQRNKTYEISCPNGKSGTACTTVYDDLKDSSNKNLKTFSDLGYTCTPTIKSGFVLGKQDSDNKAYFSPSYYTPFVNMNGPYNDLKNYVVDNLSKCADDCTKESACSGFVFGKNDKKCWLKNSKFDPKISDKTLTSDKNFDTYLKKSITYKNNPNKNGPGLDYKNYISESETLCSNDCTTDPNCGGFVYSKNNKKCWLKNTTFATNPPTLTNDNNCNTYIKNTTSSDLILDDCPRRKNYHPISPIKNFTCDTYTKTTPADLYDFANQTTSNNTGSTINPYYVSNPNDLKTITSQNASITGSENTTVNTDVSNNFCYQSFKEFNLFPSTNPLAVNNKNLNQNLKTTITDTSKLNDLYLAYSSAFNDPDLSYTDANNIKKGVNEVLKKYPLKTYCCNRRQKTDPIKIRIPLDPTKDYSSSTIDVKKFGFDFRNLPAPTDDICPTNLSKNSTDCDIFMKFYCETVANIMKDQGLDVNKELAQYAPECQCYAPNTPANSGFVNIPSVCYKPGCDSGTTTYLDPGSRESDGNAKQCSVQVCSQVLNVAGNTAGGGVNVAGSFNNNCSQNTATGQTTTDQSTTPSTGTTTGGTTTGGTTTGGTTTGGTTTGGTTTGGTTPTKPTTPTIPSTPSSAYTNTETPNSDNVSSGTTDNSGMMIGIIVVVSLFLVSSVVMMSMGGKKSKKK
jgi:hypothetical protein